MRSVLKDVCRRSFSDGFSGRVRQSGGTRRTALPAGDGAPRGRVIRLPPRSNSGTRFNRTKSLAKARLEFARSLATEGEAREAAGHYLRLVEQNPDDGVAHLELARLAIGFGDFQMASTHVRRAFELRPRIPGRKSSWRRSFPGRRCGTRRGHGERGARRKPGEHRRPAGSDRGTHVGGGFRGALDLTDAALADAPDDPDLNVADWRCSSAWGTRKAWANSSSGCSTPIRTTNRRRRRS